MNDPTFDFGHELAELREQRGLTWDELARRANVSRTYLQDMAKERRGQGAPSPEVVQRIAAALGVEPDHFRITRARAVLERPTLIDSVYARLRSVRPRPRPPARKAS